MASAVSDLLEPVSPAMHKVSDGAKENVTKERSAENRMKQPNWACRQFR